MKLPVRLQENDQIRVLFINALFNDSFLKFLDSSLFIIICMHFCKEKEIYALLYIFFPPQ